MFTKIYGGSVKSNDCTVYVYHFKDGGDRGSKRYADCVISMVDIMKTWGFSQEEMDLIGKERWGHKNLFIFKIVKGSDVKLAWEAA